MIIKRILHRSIRFFCVIQVLLSRIVIEHYYQVLIDRTGVIKRTGAIKRIRIILWNLRILSLSVRINCIGLPVSGRQEWNAVLFLSGYNS